jgi:hypothetical protein
MIKSFKDIYHESNEFGDGSLQDVVNKFAKASMAFSTFIKPFFSLNEYHKQELFQEAKGDNDYQSLQSALTNLERSILAFSRFYKNIGSNPQQFVDSVVKWINRMIEDMNSIRDFSVENNHDKDDIVLFEQAKQSYQQAMINSKNLYDLLDSYNKNCKQLFNLTKWPTQYF